MASFEASVVPSNPEIGNLVTGSVGNSATTLLSIPAGRTWVGTITINATAAGTVALAFSPSVVTPNTAGVYPQNSTVAICLAATAAVAGGSSSSNSSTTQVTVKNTTASAINLTTALTGAGTSTNAAFIASGVLV